jgi:CBS domain-containing protein
MRVHQLMKGRTSEVITIDTMSTVSAAAHLLVRHGIGGLPVIGRDGRVAGFVAEREIVAALDRHTEPIGPLPVERIMRRPVPTCSVDDPVADIMARITRERLRHMVVLDGGRIVGIVSVGDIVKNRLEQLEMETGVLRDYVAAQRAVD